MNSDTIITRTPSDIARERIAWDLWYELRYRRNSLDSERWVRRIIDGMDAGNAPLREELDATLKLLQRAKTEVSNARRLIKRMKKEAEAMRIAGE